MILGFSGENVPVVAVPSEVKGWKNVLTNGSQIAKSPSPRPDEEITASGIGFAIPDTVTDRFVSSMENAVVGHFLSFRPMVDMVRRWAMAKWRLKGSVDICAMAGGIFLFKFTTSENLILVLSSSPWVYGKHSMALCRWKPRFDRSGSQQISANVGPSAWSASRILG